MNLEPIGRVADLRAVERAAAGAPLMERAGHAAAAVARDMLEASAPRVLVLAGPGNNGGDAFVVARWLKGWFFDVTVAFHSDESQLPTDAAAAHRRWCETGGAIRREWPEGGPWGLIVDGLFGIGFSRAAEGVPAQWIERANASGAPILALDIPSGLDADTGVAYAPTIRARRTATFLALKPGLLTADGPDHCGTISVHALEVQIGDRLPGHRLDWEALASALPETLLRRGRNVHKGRFGTLGIVGGSEGMVGAAILAGRAAVALGAGKVWVGLAATERPAVDWVAPELMLRDAVSVLADRADALVVGPGLGRTTAAHSLLEEALGAPVPLALDADGLNLVSGDADLARRIAAREAPTVLTPHPAEAARLLATDTAAVQRDRLSAALATAAKFRAHVVLKGAGSVLASADGTWAINATGNAGLASGGTGDVLTGMIGALLAQGLPANEALPIAVCLHGAAADVLVAEGVGPLGLAASEIPPAARRLVNAARGNDPSSARRP
ncbi:MAG TPA: NAD(P)H-hydrate dehydratase [Casimicrobiaceae bacterium]|nr:NAD(P)H-hydrate dehydratase [Casimicrobiaceae bacterium]